MSNHNMPKRYVAEFIGTFLIVLAPCGHAATVNSFGGSASLLAAAIVSGLPVLAAIYALGPISAAHFNPAVSIGFAISKKFPWRYAVPYIAAQLLGGVLAAGIVFVMFGSGHGAHIPAPESTLIQQLGTEFLITFFLMFVIMAVATDNRVSGAVPAIAIGFTVVTGVLIGGYITGGSMNPARSFGPAAVYRGQALESVWIYFAAPIGGAIAAALLYEVVRIEKHASQGAPNELLEALEDISET